MDIPQLIERVIMEATATDGSEIARKGGHSTHTGDMEVRVAALQLLSVCTMAGQQVAAGCFRALLSNIAGFEPHPDPQVQRVAGLGLQAWWEWLAVELQASSVQAELAWVVPKLLDGVEAVMNCEGGDVFEAAGLASMLLKCPLVVQHEPTRLRLEAVATHY